MVSGKCVYTYVAVLHGLLVVLNLHSVEGGENRQTLFIYLANILIVYLRKSHSLNEIMNCIPIHKEYPLKLCRDDIIFPNSQATLQQLIPRLEE